MYQAAAITISDKGSRGERKDESGPALCELLSRYDYRVVYTAVVPDETAEIQRELLYCCDELRLPFVVTTGGTGFSPRDITPEATAAIVERATPGIPELMRAESMKITPKGCLSRSFAGIRKRTLIVNLPGSPKAAKENIECVLMPIQHGLEMLLGEGSADCATTQSKPKEIPSLDEWLKEAKASENAKKIGMVLTHVGVVRQTGKAQVREGKTDLFPVCGMNFSYDAVKAEKAAREVSHREGIYHVRYWLNEGKLSVGDDLMRVLIGGDTRPHVVDALQWFVEKLKTECVCEEEIYETNEK